MNPHSIVIQQANGRPDQLILQFHGVGVTAESIMIFVSFADSRPAGTPEDVLTSFVDGEGNALGRPVGVAVDRAGALLVCRQRWQCRLARGAGEAKAVLTPGAVQAVAATGEQRDPFILQQG